MFSHTYAERGSWRGWFQDGQVLEISWPRESVGIRLLIHSRDSGHAQRFIWLGFGFVGIYIPIGFTPDKWTPMEEPSWGLFFSREFGIVWHWNKLYKSWRWTFHPVTLDWSYETQDGDWQSIRDVDHYVGENEEYVRRPNAKSENHSYLYERRSGEI